MSPLPGDLPGLGCRYSMVLTSTSATALLVTSTFWEESQCWNIGHRGRMVQAPLSSRSGLCLGPLPFPSL